LWPDIERGFSWVHQAAHILANHNDLSGDQVHQQYSDLLDIMSDSRQQAGTLEPAIQHFLKVSRSYEPGLFQCYDVPDLPRTNNDLEQLFGSFRYHERRASGRTVAAPSVVVRGSARLIASTATRQRTFSADDLAQCDDQARRRLRASLDKRRLSRVQQRRFRRDSPAFLAHLQQRLLKLILPA
jgi:hypothetical protein